MADFYAISVRRSKEEGWQYYSGLGEGVIEGLHSAIELCDNLVADGEYYAAGVSLEMPSRVSSIGKWCYITTSEHGLNIPEKAVRRRKKKIKSAPLPMRDNPVGENIAGKELS